ncbi:MAG: hypothetical protein ACLR0N_14735 [Bilophila wadsworthia]
MDKLIPLGVWGIGNDHEDRRGQILHRRLHSGLHRALLEDYYTAGYKGCVVVAGRDRRIIIKYHCLGFQVAVHTNGDAASESVIRFEKAVEWCPRTDLRHMLIMRSFPTRSLSA